MRAILNNIVFLFFQQLGSFFRCASDEHKCLNINKCIPEGMFCNAEKDCPDGSDEYDGCVDSVSESGNVFPHVIAFIFLFALFFSNSNKSIILFCHSWIAPTSSGAMTNIAYMKIGFATAARTVLMGAMSGIAVIF